MVKTYETQGFNGYHRKLLETGELYVISKDKDDDCIDQDIFFSPLFLRKGLNRW